MSSLGFFAVVLGLAVVVGGAGAKGAGTALPLLLAPLVAVAVIASSTVRLAFVVCGALVVFQASTAEIKYFYLGLAALSVGISLLELLRDDDDVRRAFRPMLIGSVVVMALMVASYFNAHAFGATSDDWFRDMLPYLMCAALPIVGLEAGRKVPPRILAGVFGVLGVVSAIAFAADWLHRRGAVDGVGRFILATSTLPLLMLAYAIVRASSGNNRVRWAAVAIVIPAALLISGTRTYLVVFVAVLLGLVGSRAKGRIPAARMLQVVGIGGSLTAALVFLLARDWLSNSAFVRGRVTATVSALSGHATTDQSYVLRETSYRLAKDNWLQHPWTGTGPGHLYQNGTFSLDTPLQVLAKFGVLGAAVLIAYLVTIAISVRRASSTHGAYLTAGRSWAFALVALLPFGSWFEDKGTSLALTLLVCAVASVAYAQRESAALLPQPSPVPDRAPARPVLR